MVRGVTGPVMVDVIRVDVIRVDVIRVEVIRVDVIEVDVIEVEEQDVGAPVGVAVRMHGRDRGQGAAVRAEPDALVVGVGTADPAGCRNDGHRPGRGIGPGRRLDHRLGPDVGDPHGEDLGPAVDGVAQAVLPVGQRGDVARRLGGGGQVRPGHRDDGDRTVGRQGRSGDAVEQRQVLGLHVPPGVGDRWATAAAGA